MVHDAGLRHGAEDRLQTVLETGWWMAAVDANYDSQLDQMIVATSNKFTVLKKLADDIAVLLQPARSGSSLRHPNRPPWPEPLSSTGGPATARRRHEECPPGGRARREAPRPARIRRPTHPRVRANRVHRYLQGQ